MTIISVIAASLHLEVRPGRDAFPGLHHAVLLGLLAHWASAESSHALASLPAPCNIWGELSLPAPSPNLAWWGNTTCNAGMPSLVAPFPTTIAANVTGQWSCAHFTCSPPVLV